MPGFLFNCVSFSRQTTDAKQTIRHGRVCMRVFIWLLNSKMSLIWCRSMFTSMTELGRGVSHQGHLCSSCPLASTLFIPLIFLVLFLRTTHCPISTILALDFYSFRPNKKSLIINYFILWSLLNLILQRHIFQKNVFISSY